MEVLLLCRDETTTSRITTVSVLCRTQTVSHPDYLPPALFYPTLTTLLMIYWLA